MHKRDTIFCTICKAGAFVALLLMVGLFAQLLDRDDAVDAMRSEHHTHARAAILHCPAAVEYYVSCIGLARDLECIADLATDICRQLIYLRTGCITRHKSD